MQKNILLFIVLISISVYGSEDILNKKENVSKGALIEAAFIVQNKCNTLNEYRESLKQHVKNARNNNKALRAKKEQLELKLLAKRRYLKVLQKAHKKSPARALKIIKLQQEIDSIEAQIAQILSKLYYNAIREQFYPNYKKEIDLLKHQLESDIKALSEEAQLEPQVVVRKAKRADVIKDTIEIQSRIVELMELIEDKELGLEQRRCLLENKKQQQECIQKNNYKIAQLKALKQEIRVAQAIINKLKKQLNSNIEELAKLKEQLVALGQELTGLRSSKMHELKEANWFLETLNTLQQDVGRAMIEEEKL